MVGFSLSLGDRMDFEIQRGVGQGKEILEARLLAPLPEGRREGVPLPVIVPSHLQPLPEPAVVVQQHSRGRRMYDEGAADDVPGDEVSPGEAVRFRGDEV